LDASWKPAFLESDHHEPQKHQCCTATRSIRFCRYAERQWAWFEPEFAVGRSLCSLADLPRLDLEALCALWSRIFASAPPPGAKRELLIRLLAYGLQERIHGPLSRVARRNLSKSCDDQEAARTKIPTDQNPSALRLGARLVRSWNGTTHEVTVVERGFAYRGKHYRSLSEVAEVITGAHRSGPRFFGLKKAQSKKAVRDSA
jgi:hypothetical protein